jgi:hypothetical protein
MVGMSLVVVGLPVLTPTVLIARLLADIERLPLVLE